MTGRSMAASTLFLPILQQTGKIDSRLTENRRIIQRKEVIRGRMGYKEEISTII